MVKADVIDLSASKAKPKAQRVNAEVVEAKPEPAKKPRVAKPAAKVEPKPVAKMEEPKPAVVEQPKPVAKPEEPKPDVPVKKLGRFAAGSPEAKAWGEKMRAAKLAKKKAEGEQILLETSD